MRLNLFNSHYKKSETYIAGQNVTFTYTLNRYFSCGDFIKLNLATLLISFFDEIL